VKQKTSKLATDGLPIYDAAYLERAMSNGASLATTDHNLAKTARGACVAVLAG
jgi:predicted nucleic acid-binding protein